MTANEEQEAIWQKCPICLRSNTRSPEFNQFLPLINHLMEHLVPPEVSDEDPFEVLSPEVRVRRKPTKQKFPPRAKHLLLMVASWLEEALATLPEVNEMHTSDVLAAEQLVVFVGGLP